MFLSRNTLYHVPIICLCVYWYRYRGTVRLMDVISVGNSINQHVSQVFTLNFSWWTSRQIYLFGQLPDSRSCFLFPRFRLFFFALSSLFCDISDAHFSHFMQEDKVSRGNGDWIRDINRIFKAADTSWWRPYFYFSKQWERPRIYFRHVTISFCIPCNEMTGHKFVVNVIESQSKRTVDIAKMSK